MSERYFFDTYALIRLARGEPSYDRFSTEPVHTDSGCLYEFVRWMMKTENAARARDALGELHADRLVATDDDLLHAAKLLRQHPRMSGQDALGYCIARRGNMTFLTGDGAFRRLPGVELVF